MHSVKKNSAHIENPRMSLKKKPRENKAVDKGENLSLPTQTKRSILPKKHYNVERIELDHPSYHVNKTKRDRQKSIIMKRKQERTHDKPRSMQKIDHGNTIKKDKYDKSGHLQRAIKVQKQSAEQEKPKNNKKLVKQKLKEMDINSTGLEYRLSSKIWQLMSNDLFSSVVDEKKANDIQVTDSEMKNYITSVIKKYNKKELKHCNPPGVTQTSNQSFRSGRHRRRSKMKKLSLKRKVRRQLWQWAKIAIRNNEHWRNLFEESHIILDNINIDKIDLSIIDVEALGIKNKLLKRAVVWLLK